MEKAGNLPLAVPMEDAPRLFGMSKSHLYRMGRAGRIDLRKLGRKTLVMTDTVVAYLGSLPTTARPAQPSAKNPK